MLACTHFFRDHSAGAANAARQGIPVYVPEGERDEDREADEDGGADAGDGGQTGGEGGTGGVQQVGAERPG